VNRKWLAGSVIPLLMIPCALGQGGRTDVFARQNLLAWCIVPYDAAHRGPAERARMLKRLGITMLAYDWREKDIPAFDQEIDALREYGITLQGFWLRTGLEPEIDKHVPIVLDVLKRHRVRTQLWCPLDPPAGFASLPQEDRFARATRALRFLADQAGAIGCSVGFYSHGGWMGQPENQLEILRRAARKNTGIVYNFEHGRDHMDRFAEFFPKLVPHLMAVVLNGMRKGGPDFINVGEGDRDLSMLKVIRASGYHGPIGLMNHDETRDAEAGLKTNVEGLKKLLREMGDEAALETYLSRP
jgi:sugar phosphate isomerase/epimerase